MYAIISSKINNIDNYILYAIRRHLKSRCLDIMMPIITCLGNLGAIWIAIAIILSVNAPNRKIGIIVIFTLAVSTIIGEGIIKHIVKRDRPCNTNKNKLLISKPITYSFPSGHTLSSFAAASVLSMYFTKYKLVFMVIAFLIALSRLYLYVHYPTDVLAGIILGIMCSKIVITIIQDGYVRKLVGLG